MLETRVASIADAETKWLLCPIVKQQRNFGGVGSNEAIVARPFPYW